MATYQSNIMVKQTGSNAGKVSPAELGGRVRVVHGEFIPGSALAAGSVIELARIPKGARVLPLSQIHFEAGQNASLTVKVGDSADDDRYFAAAAPGANATTINLNANRLGHYVLPTEDVIKMTTGAQSLASGKKIFFDLFYVID